MRGQWGLLSALIFALIIAIFSVINVNAVTVNYLFGYAEWPLILVILGSVLMGGLIVGSIGIVRVYRLQRAVKRLTKQLHETEEKLNEVTGDQEKERLEEEKKDVEEELLKEKNLHEE